MLNSNKAVEREAPLNRALRFAAGNAFYYAACAVLLAVAAALRFLDLAGRDISYDEAVDIVQARGSLSEIIEQLRCCNSHPIGRSLLLGAVQLASDSEFSVRAPSAFASVLTVGVLALLLPRVGIGKPAAFLAGLMAALSPPAILHARDAGVYSIDALVAALMIIGLLAYLKNGKKALLCVSLLLAPLTQYGLTLFAAAALAALAAAKALACFAPQRIDGEAIAAPPYDAHRGAGRRAALGALRLCGGMVWPIVCFAAGSALTYALTLRYQLSQAERVAEYLSEFYYRSSEAASVPAFLLARIWDTLNHHTAPLVALAGLGALCAVAVAFFATRSRIHPIVLLFALSMAAAGAAATMNVYPLGSVRHSVYLGPVVFAAFAYALYAPAVRFPARARAAWGVSLVVVVVAAGVVNLAERNPYDAPRGLERVFAALDAAPAEDAIFVTLRLSAQARFYRGERASAYSYGDCSWGSVDECLAEVRSKTGRVNGSGRMWLLLQDNDIVAQLQGWLDQAGAERVAANSRTVNLYLIRDRESVFGGGDALQSLPSDEPAARGVFDVHVDSGHLAYLKEPCSQADTEALFFLRLVPERVSDLPEERAADGFERLDFEFFRWGWAIDGKCIARVPLPEYAVASVRTGQRTREAGELWDAAFTLDPAPYRAAYAEAASREPDARAQFDLHLDRARRTLTLTRTPCAQSDVQAPFFLHVAPERVGDLPEGQRASGYDNLDFDFRMQGVVFDGKCASQVPLPSYAIVGVRTGQWTREEGELWDAALPFDSAPYRAAYAEAAAQEPDARAQFDLHLDRARRTLTYARTPCAQSDVQAPFFLHVAPERVGDLPEGQRASGYDNLDFDFRMQGVVFDGKCASQVPLPSYAIVGVRTGQWTREEGELWDAALPFDSAPYRAAYAEAAAQEPDARAQFDLHLDRARRTLTYARTPCAPSDIQNPIFLHVTPERAGDLPEGRRVYGYDNLDFDFRIRGAAFDDKCAARVPLPDYAIASIRTGQFVYGGNEIWKTEFAVGLPAA